MIDRSIRDRREKLRQESIRLSELFMEQDDFNFELYEEQDEIYKKWKFYDNLIKNIDKVKE